ncbi:MAG: hypothetical protein U0M08_06970, partial [Clostridia bacterium]|nr:hypothetical protein [Clostridia bacterium]
GDDTALKLILDGSVSPEVTISDKAISDHISGKLFYLEIVNKTDSLFNYEMLKNDPTVRGAFFNALFPELSSEDEEERQKASEALRYGLSALRGNNIF